MKLRTKLGFLFVATAVIPMVFVETLHASVASIVGIVAIFLVMIVALSIAESISDPIRKLTEASQGIYKGKLEQVKNIEAIKTKDEIGALAVAFRGMVQRLIIRTRGLEAARKEGELHLVERDERIRELEDARAAMANLLDDFEVKQTELIEAMAKDDALLESIGDGLIVVDQDKKIIVINREAENLLGLKKGSALGRTYEEAFSSQDALGTLIPWDQRPLSFVLRTGQKFSIPRGTTHTTSTVAPTIPPGPVSYVRSDGTAFPVAFTIAPVIVEGQIVGAVDIFRDITKEKEIEKLRIDFLSLASHQLRTPLSGTKWLIETMRRGVTGTMNKKQEEYLTQIYGANERMIALVADMLDVLKLESSSTFVNKENISVKKLYEVVLLAQKDAASKRNISIHSELPEGEDLTVETDLGFVQMIMGFFVSNAIQYSNEGQGVVMGATKEPGTVTLFVKDSGIGVPKDEQEKIFDRFYRASNAKQYIPDGTGLGLYRATLLAEKLGAKISVDSEEGKGATFYLRLPKPTA